MTLEEYERENETHTVTSLPQTSIFTPEDLRIMWHAAQAIGLAADHVQCEVCRKWWDTISPCALCNASGRR